MKTIHLGDNGRQLETTENVENTSHNQRVPGSSPGGSTDNQALTRFMP